MDRRLFSDWWCPNCGTRLIPLAISQSEAIALLALHKGDCRRRPLIRCAEPGCFARVREDRLAEHVKGHDTEKDRPASMSGSTSPSKRSRHRPFSRRTDVPQGADGITAQPGRLLSGLPQEGRCEVCHRIMPSSYLPFHLESDGPGHPRTRVILPFRLLPPGVWGAGHILEYYRNEACRWLGGRSVDIQRLERIERLNPNRRSVGTRRHLGYILFEFVWSRAVILECPVEGNATYILWGDWHGLLQLTQSELCLKPNCMRVIRTDRSFGRVIAALDGQE